MPATIDYFYTHISPWAYLGHSAFLEIAEMHGATVCPRPVDLSGVFAASGGQPLAKRHQARQDYRFIELQRWRVKRAVPLNFKPEFFPTPPTLADCCAIVLAEEEGQAMAFTKAAFEAVWVSDQNIADETVVLKLLEGVCVHPGAVLDAAGSDDAKAIYHNNQELAIGQGVIGSPCYLLNGEPFWGQDRLSLLDDALSTDREPFGPL